MVRHFCDLCNKETEDSESYTITLTQRVLLTCYGDVCRDCFGTIEEAIEHVKAGVTNER